MGLVRKKKSFGISQSSIVLPLDLLGQFYIPEERVDRWILTVSAGSLFWVASFFFSLKKIILQLVPVMFPMESEGAFNGYCTWVAGTLGGSVLTMNNLCWQNRIIVNASLVYLTNDEEAMDHLMLNCRVAQVLWSSVLSWFLCSWVFLCSLFVVFEAWVTCEFG